MTDKMKALIARIQMNAEFYGRDSDVVRLADALEAALSPLPDEQLDEIEKRMFDAAQAIEEGNDLAPLALAACGADVPTLLAEVRRLRTWKSEAMQVLSEWEQTWQEAGRPGRLGGSKAVGLREEIARLRALSPHPDEETKRKEVVITARQSGKSAQMVEMLLAIAAERGLDVRVIEQEPDEETVTTVEELDALPVGAVVRTDPPQEFPSETTYVRFPGGWTKTWYAGFSGPVKLPARVLYRPVPEGSETA